jgi:hypothetical protein
LSIVIYTISRIFRSKTCRKNLSRQERGETHGFVEEVRYFLAFSTQLSPRKNLDKNIPTVYIRCILIFWRLKMMKRTNIYLTEIQMRKFKSISKKAGYPVAELIRRALDEWLVKYEAKEKK